MAPILFELSESIEAKDYKLTQGKFSIVVALFDVDEYVQSFLESLQNQTYSFRELDVIIVDDGSPDGSFDIAADWASRFPNNIRVVRKENGGPGSARNVGLALARNEWITFPDPDDTLHPEYFSEVQRFLARDKSRRIEMVTTRLVQHEDGTIMTNHGHPLDWKFRSGNRLIDLDSNPDFVHLSGGTVFVKKDVVDRHALRFDESIRPKFEDANFIGRYLALVPKPVIAIVASARYFYRKRSDGSSLIQSSWSNPGVYDAVPRLGYLGLLKSVKAAKGYVPRWAQSMVIYELVWAYAEQKNMHSVTGAASEQQKDTFLSLFDEILTYLDEATILEFGTISQGWIFHNILLSGVRTDCDRIGPVVQWAIDNQRETIKYSYLFQGEMPSERIVVNGKDAEPIAEKLIAHDFFGRVGMIERVLILPYGELRIFLDGNLANLTSKAPLPKRKNVQPLGAPRKAVVSMASSDSTFRTLALQTEQTSAETTVESSQPVLRKFRTYRKIDDKLQLQALLLHKSKKEVALDAASRVSSRLVRQGISALAQSKKRSDLALANSTNTSNKYKDAWILIDRKDRADDNAEHLYRYISKNRRDLNVWFVIQRDSPEWERLATDGFKLLPYGSLEAAKALRHAAYNISSHADRDIQYPAHYRRYGNSTAKIVFLQHGVTKDDLSRWLNPKRIALMITSTKDEYNSIVGDNTNYKLISSEVAATGFPRHDRLRHLTLESRDRRRTSILIAPTWRQYLTSVFDSSLSVQDSVSEFEGSDFGRNWLALLNDRRLEAIASRHGLRIKFLAHPNLTSIAKYLNLPDYIDVLDYSEISVQHELISSAIVVSDFSSLAFDGAYAGANVIHFQFDGDEIYRGGHVYRKGYFDYERDGFGPLVNTVESVVNGIEQMAAVEFVRQPEYEQRVTNAFEFWDENNCERVTIAIENISRPWWNQKAFPSVERG